MKKSISLILLLCVQITGIFAQNQDYPEILKEIEMIPVMVNGDNNNRINIVFLNQWNPSNQEPYNKPEMREEFIKDIEESFISALTYGHKDAHTAFSHYKEFFNVYAMWWPTAPAWENKIGQPKVEYLIREHFLPWKNEYTGWATILIMPNSIAGGGGAGRDLELRKGSAVIAGNGIAKMLHEISHTCMSIGDEYTTHATGTDALPTYSVALDYRRDEIKWRKWIDPETPIPTPYTKEYVNKTGAFEGTQYRLTDYFRNSAQGCIMGSGVFDNTNEMCVTCNQRVVMRVNSLVDIINSTTPANKDIKIKGASSMTFAVDHIKPYPNSQVVRWYLNGKLLSDVMNQDEITVNFGDLESYKLVCEITDESEFIRPDPPYAAYPVREIVWNITNSNSKAQSNELAVEIKDTKGNLSVEVKGGKAPYTYMWADGGSEATIQKATSGIYNVTVVDSEFKSGSAKHIIYEEAPKNTATSKNGSELSPSINVFAAEKDRPSGKISISAPEGCEYTYLWGDQKNIYGDQIIYEAECCGVTTMDKTVKSYWTANGQKYIDLNDKEGSVSFDIEVAREGVYPIEIIYATKKVNEYPVAIVSANSKDNSQEVLFPNTLPHYTGWSTAKVYLKLNKGKNTITIESTGKSLPNLDYIRVADSYETEPITASTRRILTPGKYSVTISDNDGNRLVEEITVGEEASYVIEEKLKFAAKGTNGVTITNPVAGYTYQWYATDVPLLYAEVSDVPLAYGTEFYPTKPGNYYVSARKTSSNMESANRVGVAVAAKTTCAKATPISPDKFDAKELLMWYDASDLNADGEAEYLFQDRGPTKMWNDKATANGKGNISANYYPNALNGLAVGGWDKEWVSPSGKSVIGYQTVIMVYKESDVSFAGTAPFRGLYYYMGKAEDSYSSLFIPTNSPLTKKGRVFLNGQHVDPYYTANPMDFCTLTIELSEPAPAKDNAGTTEGYWEGSVAEILMFDRKLTDDERKGIEEYLRLKWFVGVELEF